MSSSQEISLGEARKTVTDLTSQPEVSPALLEYANSDDPDLLKIAHYALLIEPITLGVKDHLNANSNNQELGLLPPSELVSQIGSSVAKLTMNRIEADPNNLLIENISRRRAEIVPYSKMIYPVEQTINNATKFSASSLAQAAIINALLIGRETKSDNMARSDFIKAVKASSQPALSKMIMHIVWNNASAAEFSCRTAELVYFPEDANVDDLSYKPNKDKVNLDTPLPEWTISDPLTFSNHPELKESDKPKISDIPTHDVRIGCPFSFDPKLAKDYYTSVVDDLERYHSWPEQVANLESLRRILGTAYGENSRILLYI